MHPSPSRRALVAIVVAGALLLAACGGSSGGNGTAAPGPSATSPPATGDRGPTGTGSGSVPTVPSAGTIGDWQPCGAAGAQCGTLEVPLDYARPDGPKLSLAVKKLPATGRSDRIGSLFINPGGPGGSGVDAVAGIAGALGSGIRERFDVVGWDPRGVGASHPVDCDDAQWNFYEQDLGQLAPAPEVASTAKDWADLCQERSGDVLPYLGTRNVARDLESLRIAVGDDKLNYAGFSYGTLIGLEYAELFPTHIRAMLLDGVVDPTLSLKDGTVMQSAAVEGALNKFIEYCDGRPSCKPAPGTAAAIDQVMAQARTSPSKATVAGQPVVFSPTMVMFGLISATYESALWPSLGLALQAALAGNIDALATLATSYLGGASASANLAVNCLDSAVPSGPDYEAIVAASAAAAPRVGAFNANLGRPCPFWGAPPDPLPTTIRAAGSPTIELWGTTGDNATPYVNAQHVASLLENARLVTLEGDRHTAVGQNACVIEWQTRYLVGLDPAPEGTRC